MEQNSFKFGVILIYLSVLMMACNTKNNDHQRVFTEYPASFKSKEAERLSVKAYDFFKEGEYGEAINVYEKAIEIEPDNPKLFFDISGCYFNLDNLPEALVNINRSIALDSLNPYSYNNRGLIYWKQGKDLKAINNYKHALALDSSNWVFFSNLSLAYYTSKNEKEACKNFLLAKKLGLKYSTIKDDEHLKELSDLCK